MHIQPLYHPLARLVLILVILAGSVSSSALPVTATQSADGREAPVRQTGGEEQPIYLPLAFNYIPPRMSVFGAETGRPGQTTSTLMDQAGVYWTRASTFSWAEIEPVRTEPPTYHWEVVDEAGIISMAEHRLTLMATVKDTPVWARKVEASVCSAVAEHALDEYAQFVHALVARYSQRPYRIKYWELGNEPDVDPTVVSNDSVFGCYGDKNDPYYGGGYYATMLAYAYPWAKYADPDAQIAIGGLLLDCDWTHPPQGATCLPSKFFEGILRAGGASYFDIVTFHAFPNYTGKIDEITPGWQARGGTLVGKVSFLQETMARYGVNKPILLNETALVCPDWPGMVSECRSPSANFLEKQADYISWLYVRSWAMGLKGAIWFTIEDNGWKSSGLSMGSVPKPAYRALQFTTSKLDGAIYAGQVTAFAGIQGYEFRKSGLAIWVLWAADQANHTITLPVNTTKVYDKYGTVLMNQGGAITVNSPIYVELMP